VISRLLQCFASIHVVTKKPEAHLLLPEAHSSQTLSLKRLFRIWQSPFTTVPPTPQSRLTSQTARAVSRILSHLHDALYYSVAHQIEIPSLPCLFSQ